MKFDENFLAEVGLKQMPESQREGFLNFIREEVEVRVGERVCMGLTEGEVEELESCETDEETLKWLNEKKPNFREIIDEVVNKVKEAVSKNAERILAGS